MNINEFKLKKENDILQFVAHWQAQKDKKNFPSDMNEEDWEEQFSVVVEFME